MHVLHNMEELMPTIGTPVPSPSILTIVIYKSDSTLQCVGNLYSTGSHSSFDMDFDNPFDFSDEYSHISKTYLISISDDGKVWNWLLTYEGTEDSQKDPADVGTGAEAGDMPVSETNTNNIDGVSDSVKQADCVTSTRSRSTNLTLNQANPSLMVCNYKLCSVDYHGFHSFTKTCFFKSMSISIYSFFPKVK